MGELVPGFIQPHTVPGNWEVLQIQDIATVVQGGHLGLTKTDYITSGIPAFSAAGQDGFVSEVEFSQPGVILSSIGANCGRCFRADTQWTTLANTQAILPCQDRIDHRFLYLRLNDDGYWLRSGSAQPFIKPVSVKKSWISIPPIEEQQRIAEILDTVDETIRATERVISKYEQVHAGLADDLLSGRRKSTALHQSAKNTSESQSLPASRGILRGSAMVDFQLVKLEDVLESVETGSRPKGGVTTETLGIPSIGGENLRLDGTLDLETVRRIPRLFFRDMRTGQLKPFDILINKDGAQTGKVARYSGEFPQAAINEHVFLLRTNPSMSQDYLFHVLHSDQIQPSIRLFITGSAQPGLNRSFFKMADVPCPPLQEQQRIADILDTVEETIDTNQQQLDKLQKLRAGLADDLLSGRVRTVPA